MKRIIIAVSVVLMLISLLVGCNDGNKNVYEQITPDEAKALMDSEDGYIILDVRTPEEFAERHIEGAILIPDYEIGEKASCQRMFSSSTASRSPFPAEEGIEQLTTVKGLSQMQKRFATALFSFRLRLNATALRIIRLRFPAWRGRRGAPGNGWYSPAHL